MTDETIEPVNREDRPECGLTRRQIMWRLFAEFFKISLFVIGGGYAIIIAADDVFGRRLRWIDEGELIERLPLIQGIPGLLAGNAAMYVGSKMAGTLGAFVALVAITIPSMIILTAIAMGFEWLPIDNRFVNGAFLGLRSSLCGIVLATVIKSWGKSKSNTYSRIALPAFCVALIVFKVNAVVILVGAMVFGVLWMELAMPLLSKATSGERPVQ